MYTLSLDLLLQPKYDTSCNLIYFDFFYQSLVKTFICIAIEPIYKVVTILVVLLQPTHGTCGN
jgi:hypothetical protein